MTNPAAVTVTDPRRRERARHRHAVALVAVGALLIGCADDGVDDDVAIEEPDTDTQAQTDAAPAPEEVDEAPTDADEAPDETDNGAPPVVSGEAPRADVPIFPGAQLVHEQVLEAAVEEVWAVDAPLEEVLEFYAAIPGLEELPGSAIAADDGGGYLELEVFSLVREGVTDPEAYEAAVAEAPYGPLLRMAVVTRESQMLAWFGGEAGREAVPQDRTVIVFGVLTG